MNVSQREERSTPTKPLVTTKNNQFVIGPVVTLPALGNLLDMLGLRRVSGGAVELDCLATIGAGAVTRGSLDFRTLNLASNA